MEGYALNVGVRLSERGIGATLQGVGGGFG
jgi:hypothetical protein